VNPFTQLGSRPSREDNSSGSVPRFTEYVTAPDESTATLTVRIPLGDLSTRVFVFANRADEQKSARKHNAAKAHNREGFSAEQGTLNVDPGAVFMG
jgi:hypothetical protein